MLVAHPVGMTPAAAAVFRIGEIFLGGIVGVAATLFIFPTHAHTAVMTRLNSVLVQLEAILASHAARLILGAADESAMDIYLTNRASLATLQTAMADAARESASRLGTNRHTEATPRAGIPARAGSAARTRAPPTALPTDRRPPPRPRSTARGSAC
jgi:hypothetical protein